MRLMLSSQMQSLAIAMLNASPRDSIDATDLFSHPESKVLGASYYHATFALKSLYKRGLIGRFLKGAGRNKYAYELTAEKKKSAIDLLESRSLAREQQTITAVSENQQDHAKLDGIDIRVDKATGLLKIMYNGVSITLRVEQGGKTTE